MIAILVAVLATSHAPTLEDIVAPMVRQVLKQPVCADCGEVYTASRLSRSRLVEIADATLSRHGRRGGRSSLIKIAVRENPPLDPKLKNPRSTAYGLFQFLNSTWKGTGIEKTNCEWCQTEAAVRYIKARYGTMDRAWRFWQRNKWY